MRNFPYVILGGGMVAGNAAQELVAQGLKAGELCIVASESALPYERPPLSKDYLAGKANQADILINDEAFYKEHGVELLLNTTIASADLHNKQLHTENGEIIPFSKLLIATGARVRTLEVPGANLQGIYYLRSLNDSQRIREAAEKAKRAVVIGGGYISLEVSAVLAQRGIATTVVLPGDTLLPRLFTPQMSGFFQKYYEERGVAFAPNSKATGFKGNGQVENVVLDTGKELPAHLVVVGIGVVPETTLFENSGLELEQGSIAVNEYLETNRPDVYAAGDVVSYYDVLSGTRRHVEHWNNAVEGGKHVARVIMGQREPYKQLPYFFSDEFDLSWEFWGDAEGHDQVVHRGDIESAQFSVWWLKQERLIAAFVMNRPDEERELAQQWITVQHRVNRDVLQDVATPLSASN